MKILLVLLLAGSVYGGAQAQPANQSPIPNIEISQGDCPGCARRASQQACVTCAMKNGWSAAEANSWCARREHCRKK